jgi:hypothetical protein
MIISIDFIDVFLVVALLFLLKMLEDGRKGGSRNNSLFSGEGIKAM